jgi:hypothetical protein
MQVRIRTPQRKDYLFLIFSTHNLFLLSCDDDYGPDERYHHDPYQIISIIHAVGLFILIG